MGPSKRKGSVRRQVLDLNTREDSPSRPTWQTKYQNSLPGEEIHENGDSPMSFSSSKSNPLTVLLGNYDSDSDTEEPSHKPINSLDAKVENFLKEIQSISAENSSTSESEAIVKQPKSQVETSYPPSVTSWQQCYDPNSGYPYYWNILTNEVTWEMPPSLKKALANAAIKQKLQEQSFQTLFKEPEPKAALQKNICKYPWQQNSDSENEKIELLTSFGSQIGAESDFDEKNNDKGNTKKETQYKSSYPSKIKSNKIKLAPEDPEGLNDSTYETSSLLTHSVQDTGPPGDDSFQKPKYKASDEKISKDKVLKTGVGAKSQIISETSNLNQKPEIMEVNLKDPSKSLESANDNKILFNNAAEEVIAEIEKELPPDYKNSEKLTTSPKLETPDSEAKPSLALIANYGDDSESEDNSSFSDNCKSFPKSLVTSSKPLFPIQIPEINSKPLFACVNSDLTKSLELPKREQSQGEPESSNNMYSTESEAADPAAVKAFKRKKRIEFATVIKPEISKAKSLSPDKVIRVPPTQYNLDPNENEHQGFGFNALNIQEESEKKIFKGYDRIQFVKAEILNFSSNNEKATKPELENNNTCAPKISTKESMKEEEIEDAATLLREKVNFLAGGISQIPPIQQMAIELETLYNAWRQCALTPNYLGLWLSEKCGELLRHEKAAAPPGWTCLWDREMLCLFRKLLPQVHLEDRRRYIRSMVSRLGRSWRLWFEGKMSSESCSSLLAVKGKNYSICFLFWDCRKSKRYFYRNSATKEIEWEYPKVEEKGKAKEGDIEGCGDEMDICDTPPHVSPARRDKHSDEPPSPPLPSVESEVSENASSSSPTPQAPPPPQISFPSETKSSSVKMSKKKRRKTEEQVFTEGDADSCSTPPSNAFDKEPEKSEATPPLPPLPPPPPPDESPPPLPDSPLPLPLDPNQPLPPGVDEPEYSLYTASKHSYKKTAPDSAAYSTELMLTYGYGLPVQQVVSSGGQPITMPMQPLEYHSYVHESVSNPYLVQSAPSHVIHCPAKKPKPSLTSELVSFYSDIALLDSSSPDNSASSQAQPSVVPSPQESGKVQNVIAPPAISTSSTFSNSSTKTDSLTSNGVNIRKKKKTKSSSTLSLKKKAVSSLVAKWQQVQQEVRKDFSDDEDEGK